MILLPVLFLLGIDVRTVIALPQAFVASVQTPARPAEDIPSSTEATPKLPEPEVYSLKVESRIKSRYAKTVVSSRIANPANKSQEVFFNVVLPETAFISGFLMEVEGKVYEAYVREKEEAKHEYEQAVASGQTAAHVALSARDSNRFTVSVNMEPRNKVTFNLTYEELLTRRLGEYSHVINLNTRHEVRDLQVDVFISEARNITRLHVPELRSGNEINPDQDKNENALARIERPSSTEAHIRFSPTVEEQRELSTKLKNAAEDSGINGQFVVQYDVSRDPQAGEVLVNNGYFVHFFAPTDLKPLHKHAIFVLDVSGSMAGRKIEQLKEAMGAILDDLNDGDYFNIVEFSYSVTVWNLDSTSQSAVFSPYNAYGDNWKANPGPTPAFPATEDYKNKAKDIVGKMRAGGGTNIHEALKTAILVAHEGMQNISTIDKPEPIIVFLTDGEPTVGEVRPLNIQSTVKELNFDPAASIFSLALGDDADLDFLKKLSLRNLGFARKIYEASDTALQLRDFYRQVASPLLANVTFSYQPDQIEEDSTTRRVFPTLFLGSELVVAGKMKKQALQDELRGQVMGSSLGGHSNFSSAEVSKASSLERMWAYLTIQQLLEEDDLKADSDANSTDKKRALELALKYSFVTPVTSLVVVKPNNSHAAGSDAVQPAVNNGGGTHYALPLAGVSASLPVGGPSSNNFGMSVDRIIAGPVTFTLPPRAPVYQHYLTTPAPMFMPPRFEPKPVMEEAMTEGHVADEEAVNEFVESLSDVSWLRRAQNDSNSVLLPVGENGTMEIYRLTLNETETDGGSCSIASSQEVGVCVPLTQCLLRVFSQDIDLYLSNYFCTADNFAGVCCPERLYSHKFTTTENYELAITTLAINN